MGMDGRQQAQLEQVQQRHGAGRGGGGGGKGQVKPAGPTRPELSPEDEKVVEKMNVEADSLGASLADGGRGGLPPETALKAFRLGGYRCEACGTRENLTLHHRKHTEGGPEQDDVPANLQVLCLADHEREHSGEGGGADQGGGGRGPVKPAGQTGDDGDE